MRVGTSAVYLPRWTKRVVTEMAGRDPLGLSRVAHALTDNLMRGIITITNRARYYSLYCWILENVLSEEAPADDDTYVSAFQRREAAIALATLLETEDVAPLGVRAVEPRLEQATEAGIADTNFRVLPSSRLGGYLANYGGCLYELGLTHRPDGTYDRVTPGLATELVAAVDATLAPTPYVKKRLFAQEHVSLKDLEKSAPRLSLDALGKPLARRERELIVDLLFGFDDGELSKGPLPRRQSLARSLFLLERYEELDLVVTKGMLEEQLLYAPAYFGVLVTADWESEAEFSAPPWLEQNNAYWGQFCLQQYFTLAVEGLLKATLDTAERRSAGLAMDELIDHLVAGDFGDMMKGPPAALLGEFGLSGVPDASKCSEIRSTLTYLVELSEVDVLEAETPTSSALAARSLALLGGLYAKWRAVPNDPIHRNLVKMAGQELWAGAVLPMLDAWWDPAVTWQDVLQALIPALLVEQHDRVMYGKGRLESCWLHREGERLLKDQDLEPQRRGSRVWQGVNMMYDLGLIARTDGSPETYRITKAGRRVLRRAEEVEI